MGCSEAIYGKHNTAYKICKFCGSELKGESRTGDRSENYERYYVYPSCECDNGKKLNKLRQEKSNITHELHDIDYKIRLLEGEKPCESYREQMMNLEISKIKKKYGFE